MKLAKELGGKYMARTTSGSALGRTVESLTGEVDEFAGAVTCLGDVKEAKINLFI